MIHKRSTAKNPYNGNGLVHLIRDIPFGLKGLRVKLVLCERLGALRLSGSVIRKSRLKGPIRKIRPEDRR